MMYICECGETFDDINEETQDHVLNYHLEQVEQAYADFIDDVDGEIEDTVLDDLYEEAILDVTDELMDEIVEG
jgi:hypothetical protein